MPIIGILISAISRALVGKGAVTRTIAYPVAVLVSAYIGFGIDWWAVPFGLAAGATLWLGYTRWEEEGFMLVRYSLLPLIVTMIYVAVSHNYITLLWPLACAAVGYKYQDMKDLCQRKGWSDQIPEAIAGASILGGLSLL